MSFEFTGLTYDPSRKVTTTQRIVVQNPDYDTPDEKKSYMPVPYNMQFELAIMCKLNDDALQIVEQILPYFQPSFNLTVDLVSSIGEKRDIPIVLSNISFQDDYEGDYATRRALIYTLRFEAKTYLFGPVAESSEGLIKKVIVDTAMDTNTAQAPREMRYTVEPDPITASPGDDFGFSETTSFFSDAQEYSPTRQEDM